MGWLVLDLLLGVLALVVLGLTCLTLWRQVKALSALVRAAGDRIAVATSALDQAQAPRPSGALAPAAPADRAADPARSAAAPTAAGAA